MVHWLFWLKFTKQALFFRIIKYNLIWKIAIMIYLSTLIELSISSFLQYRDMNLYKEYISFAISIIYLLSSFIFLVWAKVKLNRVEKAKRKIIRLIYSSWYANYKTTSNKYLDFQVYDCLRKIFFAFLLVYLSDAPHLLTVYLFIINLAYTILFYCYSPMNNAFENKVMISIETANSIGLI